MLCLLIALLVWGLILSVIWWAVTQIPVPAPFGWVIRVVFAIIVVIVLISLLTGSAAGLGLGLGARCCDRFFTHPVGARIITALP